MASGGDTLVPRLAAFISDFIAQLTSHRVGSLAQIWLPETAPDGSVELYTQGLPYSINGVGDLLALFRCISCKYKFATDPSKALQMGAVGRVFTSGEPEMSHNVQRYDQHVYLRAAEAQRCRVHSTLFMPLYDSPRRSACVGVFEVVMTDPEPNFAGMVGWIISCLSSENLYTAEVDTASLANQGLGVSVLGAGAERDGISALESGAQLRGGGRGAADRGGGAPPGAAGAAPTAHSGGSGGQAGREEQGDTKQEGRGQQAGRSPTGAASPPPQQEQKQGGGEGGSGSGAGSGQPPSQPPLLSGSGQQQQQQQHLLSQLGSGQLGSAGSLLAGLMQGSVQHSGVELPSGGVAPDAAAAVAAVPPAAVAAALQQVLQQGGSGMLPQHQLVALFGGAPGMPPALQLPGGSVPGLLNGLGSLPALAAGLQQQDVQPPPPGTQQQQAEAEAAGGGAALPQNGSMADMAAAAQQAGEDDEMDEDGTDDEDKPFLRPAAGAAQKYGQGNRILTYDDLAAQFGYGLKEAAARLNICPTTLKRACRRLGVPRWPRREIARHKKAKQTTKGDGKGDGSKADGPAGGGSQQRGGGGAPGSAPGSAAIKGLSSGSGGSGPQQAAQQQQQAPPLLPGGAPGSQLVRPASSSLLTGLPGLDQLLPLQPQLGPAASGGLPPELAAALASTLTQQAMQQGSGPLGGLPPQLVGPVMQLLQQNQGMGGLGAPPQPPLAWQAPAPQVAAGLPPGLAGLPPLLTMPRGGLPPPAAGQRQRSPPPAPALSNLGLPMRADSKLHSQGPIGSLDILAHADLEMSVGNGLSLGNGSPRLALSNLGGLSQLGLSGFDFGASLAGGAAPAATATGGAGGATGPQNGPAHSSGAVSKPREKQ